MLLERWTGIRHRIGIGTASTPTKGSLGVLVTQAQHTLGKFSLGVVCETAQTLRGILCFGAMPPFSFFFFDRRPRWLFLTCWLSPLLRQLSLLHVQHGPEGCAPYLARFQLTPPWWATLSGRRLRRSGALRRWSPCGGDTRAMGGTGPSSLFRKVGTRCALRACPGLDFLRASG